MSENSLRGAVFAVDDEPYCLWDPQLKELNSEFLANLDPEYFDYCLRTCLEGHDDKRASLALKQALHHSIETLFSLLGAYLQAPRHAYAWIAKCSTSQLISFVRRISSGDKTVLTTVVLPSVSWKAVADCVMHDYRPGTDRNSETVELYGDWWSRLAQQLCDLEQRDEYNAIKHGFRVANGGFGLAIGIEHVHGVPPPSEEVQQLAHSTFGTSFLKIEKIGIDKAGRNLKAHRVVVNWSLEQITSLSQLVYMSINNVVSALRSVNQVTSMPRNFLRPESDEDFLKPWTSEAAVKSMKIENVFTDIAVPQISREDLLKMLRENQIKL